MSIKRHNYKRSDWRTYRRLLVYVKAVWPAFLLSLLGFFLYALTQSAFAGLMQYLPSAFSSIPTESRELASWELALNLDTPEGIRIFLPAALLLIVSLRGIGSYLGGYYITFVARNVVNKLRLELFQHINLMPGSFFREHNSSRLVSIITYNVEQVTSAASNAIKVVVREGLTIIALLAYIFYLNWKLSLLFLIIAPLIALTIGFASSQFKKYSRRIQTSMGGITQVTSEAIRGFPVVRSFGGVDYENARFRQRSGYALKQDLKLARVNEISTPIIQFLTFAAIAALFWLGLDPTLRGGMSAGEFLTYITAASLTAKPLRQLSNINAGIQRGIAASESIFEILDQPVERNTGTRTLDAIRGKIECRHLTFRYRPADVPVLEDINLLIEPGETVAIVGRSGTGKSTLASLVAGFTLPPARSIFIDGIAAEDIRLESLRRHIAVVTQYTVLFEASIADNIAYGELRGASDTAIRQAADDACASEFIEQLPAGLATQVNEDAHDLSGGQRQRLALARAFLKDAQILVLDEATSALDAHSENLIKKALSRITGSRTTLIIAHRLSTVEHADRIVVLEAGRIIETGTHTDLINRNGAYANLYWQQFTDVDAAG